LGNVRLIFDVNDMDTIGGASLHGSSFPIILLTMIPILRANGNKRWADEWHLRTVFWTDMGNLANGRRP